MNLSLRLLRAFVAVGHEGNVGRAAAKLFVSQPSLSQDIRRLEREVGVSLFDRGPKGLTLTAAGDVFLRAVEGALALLDRGHSDALELASGGRWTVRIAYSPSLANKLMPALLPALAAKMPNIDVDESEVDTGDVAGAVASGRFDVGFAHCPTPDPGLAIDHLVDEPLCIALARGHRLAKRRSVELSQLRDSALLIWPRESAPDYYDAILSICADAGLQLRDIKQFRRITPRTYLLDDNQTFSLLPRSAASIRRPEVKFLAIEGRQRTVPLMCIRRSDDLRPELSTLESIARETSRQLMRDEAA